MSRASPAMAHPASVAEVAEIITTAVRDGHQVRVRGSGHSVDAAFAPNAGGVSVMLDRLRGFEIHADPSGQSALVDVGAGCHLGYDRYDPAGTSSWENGVTHQLHQAGWALPCLGGISHQTAGGFLSTGSAGGSTEHDLAATVEGIELVDGLGRVHQLAANDPDPSRRDLFEAAGVSLGLLGVITKIRFRAEPAYDIHGEELTASVTSAPLDLFDERPDAPGLATLFEAHAYSRVLWWPQPGFDRVQVWTGDRDAPRADRDQQPFEILGAWSTLMGALLQTLVGNLEDLSEVMPQLENQDWFAHLSDTLEGIDRDTLCHRPSSGEVQKTRGMSRPRADRWAARMRPVLRWIFSRRFVHAAGRGLAPRIATTIHYLMAQFVEDGTKPFRDRWYLALPMDNQLNDRLWPTAFSELWLPMQSAPEAMRRIRDIVEAHRDPQERYRRVRGFPLEFYPGPKSRFWLSPGYERKGLRVNPARFEQWLGEVDPNTLALFHEALHSLEPRVHWGKHLPQPGGKWHETYRKQLPRFEDFLRLREELDPNGVFLSDYWRAHLGIG